MAHRLTRRPGRAALCGAAATLVLSACAADPATDELDPDETTARFVACLTAAGMEVRANNEGYVLMREVGGTDEESDSDLGNEALDAEANVLWSEIDSEGRTWIAVTSAAQVALDPQTRTAYAECEAEHPEFTQPAFDPRADPRAAAQAAESEAAALEFAQCARESGFSWVADPWPNTGGAIELPRDLEEGELRALLHTCRDGDAAPFGWALADDELDDFDLLAVLEAEGLIVPADPR